MQAYLWVLLSLHAGLFISLHASLIKPMCFGLGFYEALGFAHSVKKTSVDCHHKGHIGRYHYSNSLTVSSCNLNWFDTTV